LSPNPPAVPPVLLKIHPAMNLPLFKANMIVMHHKDNALRRISGNAPLICVLLDKRICFT
jgi:hypothetical protein